MKLVKQSHNLYYNLYIFSDLNYCLIIFLRTFFSLFSSLFSSFFSSWLARSVSWPKSHDSQSRDLGVTRSWYHETLLAKWPQASFRFQISSMKIFPEIFSSVYKIILHLTLLLVKQHELMIFRSELNVIHKTGSNYISMKHHFSMLNSERMRRSEFKADELYITAQSVRQISWHSRSAHEAVWA